MVNIVVALLLIAIGVVIRIVIRHDMRRLRHAIHSHRQQMSDEWLTVLLRDTHVSYDGVTWKWPVKKEKNAHGQ